MTTFDQVNKTAVDGVCIVPSGKDSKYGCACGGPDLYSGPELRSFGYTGCVGIVTFRHTTGVYTLSHIPPAGLGDKILVQYVKLFLKRYAPTESPSSSTYFVVGGVNARRDECPVTDLTVRTIFEMLDRDPVSSFTGPGGSGCDVYVSMGQLRIVTRPDDRETIFDWAIGSPPRRR